MSENAPEQTPAAPAAPAPAAPTPPGPDLSKILTAIEGLGSRMTEIENLVTAPKPTPAPAAPTPAPAPQGPDPKAAEALAAAQKAQAKALDLARNALVRSHLTGIENPSYLKLAPAVELTEDGNLTEDSIKALDEFREANSKLFKSDGGGLGFSPMPGGKGGGTNYSQDQMRAFANAGISPGSWQANIQNNPALIASIEAARRSN